MGEVNKLPGNCKQSVNGPNRGSHKHSDHETGRPRLRELAHAADQRPFGPHQGDGSGVSAQTTTHDRQRLVVVPITEARDAPTKELILVGGLEPSIVDVVDVDVQ